LPTCPWQKPDFHPVGLFFNLLLAEIYAPLEARELIRWWSLILPFPFDCKGISNLRA
jgi:hypothetical protein